MVTVLLGGTGAPGGAARDDARGERSGKAPMGSGAAEAMALPRRLDVAGQAGGHVPTSGLARTGGRGRRWGKELRQVLAREGMGAMASRASLVGIRMLRPRGTFFYFFFQNTQFRRIDLIVRGVDRVEGGRDRAEIRCRVVVAR